MATDTGGTAIGSSKAKEQPPIEIPGKLLALRGTEFVGAALECYQAHRRGENVDGSKQGPGWAAISRNWTALDHLFTRALSELQKLRPAPAPVATAAVEEPVTEAVS